MRSERLLAISNFVKNNSIIGDVGTDHGLIPIYLYESGRIKKAIATDISPASLEKTAEKVRYKGIEEFIDTRVGDGLGPIKPYEVDTLIIAGMGGKLIIDILDSRKDIRDSIVEFILQANTSVDLLREYLYENKFEIIEEKIIKEGKIFYEIIYCRRGVDKPDDDLGFDLPKDIFNCEKSLAIDYIKDRIKKKEEILAEVTSFKTEGAEKRFEELKIRLGKLKEVLEKIEG